MPSHGSGGLTPGPAEGDPPELPPDVVPTDVLPDVVPPLAIAFFTISIVA
jgi:hypothetical protein